MSGVYSTQFIGTSLAAGATAVYTVPAAQVAIIKTFAAYCSGLTGNAVGAVLETTASGILLVQYGSSAPVTDNYVFNGSIVVPAHSSITVAAERAASVYVGGYLLDA